MNYTTRGGIDSFTLYKEEAEFAVDPGTWTANAYHFGIETSIKPTTRRNLVKVRGNTGVLPSSNTEKTSRDAQQMFAGKYEVGLSIEFEPQTFDFMEYVFGSKSGSDPYYYPQESAVTEADKKKYIKAKSFSLMERKDYGGTGVAANKAWIYSGCIINSMTMKAAMGEAITISLDAIGALTTGDSTDVETKYPYTALSSADVYNFSHADVLYDGSSIPNIIEGFDLSISNNGEILYGIGSFIGKTGVWKARDVSVSLDLTDEGTQFMDDLMGSATAIGEPVKIPTVVLKLDKGAGVDMTITLTNLKISERDAGLDFGEVTKEKLSFEAEHAYCVENQS